MKYSIRYEHSNRYEPFPTAARIYRYGKLIERLPLDRLTDSGTEYPDELKRRFRRELHSPIDNRRLAVYDGTAYYLLRYKTHYDSFAQEYEQMKELKAQLERQHAEQIVCTTAHGKTVYEQTFRIVRVNFAA